MHFKKQWRIPFFPTSVSKEPNLPINILDRYSSPPQGLLIKLSHGTCSLIVALMLTVISKSQSFGMHVGWEGLKPSVETLTRIRKSFCHWSYQENPSNIISQRKDRATDKSLNSVLTVDHSYPTHTIICVRVKIKTTTVIVFVIANSCLIDSFCLLLLLSKSSLRQIYPLPVRINKTVHLVTFTKVTCKWSKGAIILD